MPTTWTLLCSMRTSSGAHSKSSAATRAARSRTSRAVCATAGPELAATRLPPVPMPNGNIAVSPAETCTSSPPAPLVVRQERESLLEGRGEIAGIVGDGHAVLVGEAGPVRHLGGAHEVAA